MKYFEEDDGGGMALAAPPGYRSVSWMPLGNFSSGR